MLRPALVYGPHEPAYYYGPSGFLRNALTNAPITLWGDGQELREFLFVDDVVALTTRLTFGDATGVLNVASGTSYTYAQALAEIAQLTGREPSMHVASALEGQGRSPLRRRRAAPGQSRIRVHTARRARCAALPPTWRCRERAHEAARACVCGSRELSAAARHRTAADLEPVSAHARPGRGTVSDRAAAVRDLRSRADRNAGASRRVDSAVRLDHLQRAGGASRRSRRDRCSRCRASDRARWPPASASRTTPRWRDSSAGGCGPGVST